MRRDGKWSAALLVAVLGLLIPAVGLTASFPPSVGELVAKTRKMIKTVDMAGFKAALDKKQTGLIVDVREPEEYAEGHVPGAVNVPRGMIEFTIWKHVGFPDKTDMNKKMHLYCATGGRCTLATKTLQDLGFTDVTAVVMKFEDWQKAGHPVAGMTPKAAPSAPTKARKKGGCG
jgi:rhodanese-related sulfurtransferase